MKDTAKLKRHKEVRKNTKYQQFDFSVAKMTTKQAEKLLLIIIEKLSDLNLELGGGFHSTSDLKNRKLDK